MQNCHKERVNHLKKASEHLNIASSLSCPVSNDIASSTENSDNKNNNRGWKANPLCGTRINPGHYLYKKECVPPSGGKRQSKKYFLKKKRSKRKTRKRINALFRKKRKKSKTKRKRRYRRKSPKRRKRK